MRPHTCFQTLGPKGSSSLPIRVWMSRAWESVDSDASRAVSNARSHDEHASVHRSANGFVRRARVRPSTIVASDACEEDPIDLRAIVITIHSTAAFVPRGKRTNLPWLEFPSFHGGT
mmetsp:Transcript_4943/g.31638  ORF Transcript_4943/g.31638 Transcript_4943/m.31638 type:complete len:117 (+) Transcript_4943:4753-5103(+)